MLVLNLYSFCLLFFPATPHTNNNQIFRVACQQYVCHCGNIGLMYKLIVNKGQYMDV